MRPRGKNVSSEKKIVKFSEPNINEWFVKNIKFINFFFSRNNDDKYLFSHFLDHSAFCIKIHVLLKIQENICSDHRENFSYLEWMVPNHKGPGNWSLVNVSIAVPVVAQFHLLHPALQLWHFSKRNSSKCIWVFWRQSAFFQLHFKCNFIHFI